MPFILADRSKHFGGTVPPVYRNTGATSQLNFTAMRT